MRLSDKIINAIIQSIESCVTPVNSNLYLYGSRTNNNLKGGDIDLLIISKDSESYSNLINKKLILL